MYIHICGFVLCMHLYVVCVLYTAVVCVYYIVCVRACTGMCTSVRTHSLSTIHESKAETYVALTLSRDSWTAPRYSHAFPTSMCYCEARRDK